MTFDNPFIPINFNTSANFCDSLDNHSFLYQQPTGFDLKPIFMEDSILFKAPTVPYMFDFSLGFLPPLNSLKPVSNIFESNDKGFTCDLGVDSFTKTSIDKPCVNNYNKVNGEKLAKIAWKNRSGFKSRCAAFVSKALEQAGLSNGKRGHGYQMAEILRKNDNFKEVPVDTVDWKHLPAGCILCYNKGAQGYSKDYGHVEISTGNGTAVSDGVTKNIRKPSAVFVPV